MPLLIDLLLNDPAFEYPANAAYLSQCAETGYVYGKTESGASAHTLSNIHGSNLPIAGPYPVADDCSTAIVTKRRFANAAGVDMPRYWKGAIVSRVALEERPWLKVLVGEFGCPK